jgi:predicted ATP-dependent endonuclease of OLD family
MLKARQKIEINNFRGISQGELDGLAPLTILVGANNTGKSTILEALWLNAQYGNANTAVALSKRRGWCGLSSVFRLFYDMEQPIEIQAWDSDEQGIQSSLKLVKVADQDLISLVEGKQQSDKNALIQINSQSVLKIQYKVPLSSKPSSRILVFSDGYSSECIMSNSPDDIMTIFIEVEPTTSFGMLEDAYSSAMFAGGEAALESLLSRINPDKKTLRILRSDDEYVLHSISNNRSVPVYLEGDGYKRFVLMACSLAANIGHTILIEEPECFQHPRYLREFAQLVWGAIEQGSQIIMSTHSLDLLHYLFLTDSAQYELAKIFRTSLENGELKAVTISGERAVERMNDLDEDLRQ